MNLFTCTHCGQLLYFENTHCEQCGYPLGFVAAELQLRALVPAGPTDDPDSQRYYRYAEPGETTYAYCANHQHGVCNWLVPSGSPTPFCQACDLNRTIPDLRQPGHLAQWRRIEAAKHRLVYSLLRLGLPVVSKREAPDTGLQFDFKADEHSDDPQAPKVMTGHDHGLITLNIAEADDAERERIRQAMGEPYRTLLGHFRHEVGHYYWDRLIADSPYLAEYRELFGDERQDYGQALQRHYDQGPPADWPQHYISSYATMHPWEDWAETWAHYLHSMDTLETAHAFGLRVAPAADPQLTATMQEPYQVSDFAALLEQWLPLTLALNSLNRSMGVSDPYPFVIPPAVGQKLAFIHRVCQQVAHRPIEA